MKMSSDQNLSFHYGGGAFPPSFSNQNVVPFRPAAMNNAAGSSISEGMYASDGVSSLGGMILPGNPATQSYTSSVLSLPVNLSGNIILDPEPPLKLSPAATANWSLEELYVLRRGLIEHATEPTSIMKYIKIAAKLPGKTVRDVAMRCRLIAKETGKRRKLRSHCAEKKEKVVFSSSLRTAPAVQPESTTSFSLRMHHLPRNNQLKQASLVNTETQGFLIENFNLLNQIGLNLELSKVEDNINLFYRTRENITTILNRISGTPGSMNQMPPLPVLIDDNLFQSILPLASQVHVANTCLREEPRYW